MMLETPIVSLVLLGRFAPADFMPESLSNGKVIASAVASSAQMVMLIPNQSVHFKFGWGEMAVTTERLHVTTAVAPYVRLSDFVVKSVAEVSPTSIVTAFGINVEADVEMGSIAARNELGKKLAPPSAWGEWGNKLSASMAGEMEGTPLQGGLLHIQMRERFAHESVSGWLDVTVTPSIKLKTNSGVLLRSNHHHQIDIKPVEDGQKIDDKLQLKSNSDVLLAALVSDFENSITKVTNIFDDIVRQK